MKCAMKITDGLFRSTVRYDSIKCESPITVLKILDTLVGGPLHCEALGSSLSGLQVNQALTEDARYCITKYKQCGSNAKKCN